MIRLPKENISLAIVQSKPLSMVSMMSEEEDYFVKTPQKTISDILETRKITIRVFQGCVLVTESSSVDSPSNVKAPVKHEGSPIEKIEPAFYKISANNQSPSVTIKKAKTEKSG
ncbi:hypothetical protein YC2023_033124 [Brassica napus]